MGASLLFCHSTSTMTAEMYLMIFLHILTYKHQNKILPQEDEPRTKATWINIIEQFIQSAALGVKKSQNILFPFFHCPIIHVVPQNNYFLRGFQHPRCTLNVMKEQRKHKHAMQQEARTQHQLPRPVTYGTRTNTGCSVKAICFYLRGNPTLITGKTINRPHLTIEISPCTFS